MQLATFQSTLAISLVLLGVGVARAAGPTVTLGPTPAALPAQAKAPWLAVAPPTWPAEPTFVLADAKVSAKASCWLAATNEALLVHLVVADDKHYGRPGDLLWQGDFVRIAFDGYADGSRGAAPETAGPFGVDDLSLGMAMTPEGSLAVVFAGGSKLKGKLDPKVARVARDEATHQTTYDVQMPWAELGTMPGVIPDVGLAIQVKDVDTGSDEAYLRFGEGTQNVAAGRFARVSIGAPPQPLMGAVALANEAWRGEFAPVAVSGAPGTRISAHAGNTRLSGVIGPEGRARLLVSPDVVALKTSVKVKLQGKGAKLEKEFAIESPDALFARLWTRLDELIPTAAHPLFLRHLRSVRALTQTERARVDAYRDNPARMHETLEHIRSLIAGFEADAADWHAYLDGRRSLLFAFVSKRDASLQSYYVTLPKTYDPAKPRDEQLSYPLYFELHGAGNAHPLAWVASQLGGKAKALDLLGYESPKAYASIAREGYHVQPFGRGNSGYRDIGEIDVMEALADAEQTFKVDESRRYLYGFSMGGAGTWAVGSRTPDRWAAIAVYGASPAPGAEIGLARNVRTLPVWHWNGDQDNHAHRGHAAFDAELRKHGVNLVSSETPKLGHVYIAEKQKEGVQWLSTFVRKRPDKFAFVADTAEHRGVWGIMMDRDVGVSSAPSFECTISGNEVRIVSEGTKGLELELGAQGLNLSGEVTVLWNGKRVYQGPATHVSLPTGKSAPAGARNRVATN
ncbi:MAG: hypothetical protein SF187_22325 [Deltaproteobacteria bacterium]|nr:hypothetical protein [Deltaproteobacteria bacterium]